MNTFPQDPKSNGYGTSEQSFQSMYSFPGRSEGSMTTISSGYPVSSAVSAMSALYTSAAGPMAGIQNIAAPSYPHVTATGQGMQIPEPSFKKRKRQAMACTPCHLKKRRCDGTLPCQNCQFVDGICTYPLPGEKRPSLPMRKSGKSDMASSSEDLRADLEQTDGVEASKGRQDSRPKTLGIHTKPQSQASRNIIEGSAASDKIDAVAIALLDLFCQNLYPLSLSLPPGTLKRRLLAHPKRSLLLTGVCALAARLLPSEADTLAKLGGLGNLVNTAPCHLGDAFAHVTHSQLFSDNDSFDEGFDRPTPELAQSMILMVLQTAAAGRWKRGWVYLGIMNRVLKELNIQDDDLLTISSKDPSVGTREERTGIDQELRQSLKQNPAHALQREERRRIFWLAFMADCLASSLTGRPRTIRLQDIKLYLPLDEGSFLRADPDGLVYDSEVAMNVAKGSGEFLLVRATERMSHHRASIVRAMKSSEGESLIKDGADTEDRLTSSQPEGDLNEHKRKAFWQAFVKDMLSSAVSSRSRTLRPLDLNLYLVLGPQSLGLPKESELGEMDIHSIEKEQGPRIKTFKAAKPHIGAFGHLIRIVGFLGKVQACYFGRTRTNDELAAASVKAKADGVPSTKPAGSSYTGIVETPEECWAEVIEWRARLPAHLTRAPANRLWAKEMLNDNTAFFADTPGDVQLSVAERGAAWCWVMMHILASVAMYQLLTVEEISKVNELPNDDLDSLGGPPPEQDDTWIRRKRKQWLMDDVRAFLVLLGERGRRSPVAVYPLYVLTKHNVSKNLPAGEAITRKTCIPDQQIQQWWRELGPLWGVNALGMLGLGDEDIAAETNASEPPAESLTKAFSPPLKITETPSLAPADADALVDALNSIVSRDFMPSLFGDDFALNFGSTLPMSYVDSMALESHQVGTQEPIDKLPSSDLLDEDSEMTKMIDDFLSKRDNVKTKSKKVRLPGTELGSSMASPFSPYGHTQSPYQMPLGPNASPPTPRTRRQAANQVNTNGTGADRADNVGLLGTMYPSPSPLPSGNVPWVDGGSSYTSGDTGFEPFSNEWTQGLDMPYDLALLLGLPKSPAMPSQVYA